MRLTTFTFLTALNALLRTSSSQNVTVPATCIAGFSAGTDTVIYTIPYTYAQTLSIIGSFKNLTWSGNPDDTVTLNGTNNVPGTARSYSTAGANVVETLLIYSSPPGGPYYEVHNLALITVPPFNNVSTYAQYDGTNVTSVCNGRASQFNFTINFCADNVTEAALVYHTVHTLDAQGTAMLLGGANFTTCEALGSGSNSTSSATASASAPVSTFKGGVAQVELRWAVVLGGVMAALAFCAD